MKIKVTKVVFDEKQKEFDLPFPVYFEEFKPEIRIWAAENSNKEDETDESSR